MRAYQTRQLIPESHTLTVQLPPDVPAGPAEVIVLYQDHPNSAATTATPPVPLPGAPDPAVEQMRAQDLADFLDLLEHLPADGQRTRDEIDRQIQIDRDAWE